MILTADAIRQGLRRQVIDISPYDETLLNPASYDLRLGDGVRVYSRTVCAFGPGDMLRPGALHHELDTRAAAEPTTCFKIGQGGWLLHPGVGYLMHTEETVWSSDYVGVVDGKSSLGRLFISVHTTAGYIDPGFRGQITLEVTVTHPVRVYAGMRFAQLRFHMLTGAITQYAGHYTGSAALGAVAADLSGLGLEEES